MKHLTQNGIDQFVSNIENKSETISDWQDHIRECDFCSKRIDEALSFNESLSKFINVSTSPKIKEFINKISADIKETFVAYPITPAYITPNNSFVIQHAESCPPLHNIPPKYQYIGSLITKKEDILIRLIKDYSNHNIYMYLISDDKNKYQNMIVTLSNSKTKYHSDAHGKINLGKINLPNIEDLAVTIETKK